MFFKQFYTIGQEYINKIKNMDLISKNPAKMNDLNKNVKKNLRNCKLICKNTSKIFFSLFKVSDFKNIVGNNSKNFDNPKNKLCEIQVMKIGFDNKIKQYAKNFLNDLINENNYKIAKKHYQTKKRMELFQFESNRKKKIKVDLERKQNNIINNKYEVTLKNNQKMNKSLTKYDLNLFEYLHSTKEKISEKKNNLTVKNLNEMYLILCNFIMNILEFIEINNYLFH